jgi:hypothetical protein
MTIGRDAKMKDEFVLKNLPEPTTCVYDILLKKIFGNNTESCMNPQLWFYKWIGHDKKAVYHLHV